MSAEKSKFIVSARKYRPTDWEHVVGQESITSTLASAIEQEQLAHAYLFCGPRGVGKTTCARIFAKEINSDEKHDEDEDFSFNIFELDAASNNKVEDIRNLIDQVRIPPQVGRYKVYIIDEVHMLSAQAFNAFLKTLEEPPAHAIFILATTEKHKIIPTILSRCQIYDFNRIGVDEIAAHLKGIAENEKIQYEDEALHIIGQKADGALRDALSIFDQLSSFTHRNLSYDAVVKNLHVLDYDYHFKMVNYLRDGDYQSALILFDEILKLGFDGAHFLDGFSAHLRDLLIAKNKVTLPLLEVGDSVKQEYAQQSQATETAWIIEALKETHKTDGQYRNSNNQRLLIEILLLTLSTIDQKKNTEPSVSEQPKPRVEPKLDPQQRAGLQQSSPTKPEPQQAKTAATATPASSVSPPTQPASDKEPVSTTGEGRRRRSGRKLTTSLNVDLDATSETKQEDEVSTVKEVAEITYQPSATALPFDEAWKTACENALKTGRSALYAILNRQKPAEQLNEKQMEIKLLHEVEAEEFDHHKTNLLAEIRSLCNDPEITFINSVSAAHTETKLFGAKEKFEFLAEKNPLLRKLKSELDLDIH